MKRNLLTVSLAMLAIMVLTTIAAWGVPADRSLKRGNPNNSDTSEKIAMAFVVDRYPDIPEAGLFSHLVYSFAVFNDSLDGVVIRYPEKLKAMADLKRQNPGLKVLLGLNDYRRPGFCEMTADKRKRKSYIKSVKNVLRDYDLDGIVLDWEFPTIEGQGHNYTPEDDKNYVLLVRDFRKALGKKAWISYYSNQSGQWIDHKGMVPYVSYVNVSGYNMAAPKEGERLNHQSALYLAENTGERCVYNVIQRHINLGIPKEKILVGIPFFGRGLPPFESETDCLDFSKYDSGMQLIWDEEAQAPYYSDSDGNMLLGFDDERSIKAKFDFIRTNGLPGVFVWCYDGDYADHRLSKAIGKLWKGNTDTATKHNNTSY